MDSKGTVTEELSIEKQYEKNRSGCGHVRLEPSIRMSAINT